MLWLLELGGVVRTAERFPGWGQQSRKHVSLISAKDAAVLGKVAYIANTNVSASCVAVDECNRIGR